LTDGILTLASIIGFIALFGIATRNGIILVDHIRRLEQQGDRSWRNPVARGFTSSTCWSNRIRLRFGN
jgi:Cu/Ag efflux pump CusA